MEDWREIDLTTGTEGWFDELPGDCVILEINNSSSNPITLNGERAETVRDTRRSATLWIVEN